MATEFLPVDVVDHILSFLQTDRDALTTCAQSHLTLSKLSKRYIYADVTLRDDLYWFNPPIEPPSDPDNPDTDDRWRIKTLTDLRTSKFAQILAAKPDIANHVRSLKVAWVDHVEASSEQRKATSSHLDGVAALLPMLDRLTAFTLTPGFLDLDPISWYSLPWTFRQAFLRLLRPQPVIKDIVISHVSFFPISLLNNCRNIRITLRRCLDTQYDNEANPEDMLRSSVVPFEHLSLDHCSKMCLRNIAPWVTQHGLRTLEYIDLFGTSFQEFLFADSNSLTNLRLQVYDIRTTFHYNPTIHASEDLVHFRFTLAGLRHLTQLTIKTESFFESDEGILSFESPIPAIVELISTASPSLKRITIEMMFSFEVPDFERQLPDAVIVWDPFIPLADKCSSASILMFISPSFECHTNIKPLTDFVSDFKGLTPYVHNGVVGIISEAGS